VKKILIIVGVIVAVSVLMVFTLGKIRGKQEAKTTDGISMASLITQAKDFEAKGNLLSAKSAYQKLVNSFPNSSEIMSWQKKIEDSNIKMLFSGVAIPNTLIYEVKPGDTLDKIAKEFKTTVELISKSNNLTDDKITPGKQLRLWSANFSILVDKSQNTLILKAADDIIKTYIVSTGANNSTPVGVFKVVNKLKDPTWFKEGAVVPSGSPENVLGSRWLGFNLPGYGIHGTTEPQNLGKQVTQGCVRLSNSEVNELYDIVPIGTEVTIVD